MMQKRNLRCLALLVVVLLLLSGCQQVPAPVQPSEPSLEQNSYDATCFSEQDGFLTYDDGTRTASLGVDVSYYQKEIDWQAVRDAGITFAMIRVGYRGYSGGTIGLDERFTENIAGALAAGLRVGVYFFSQAVDEIEAEEEAQFVLAQIADYDITMPIMFDWEDAAVEGARTETVTAQTLTACAEAFCRTIEAAGYTPGIYFSQHMGYQRVNLGKLQDAVFWLAEYNAVPTFFYRFEMWQYTDAGKIPGIETAVDLNLWFEKKEVL